MARLLTTAVVLGTLAATPACAREPRVRPQPIQLNFSPYCENSLGFRLLSGFEPRVVSADLLVVDAAALDDARVEVVGRSPCRTIEIGADFAEIRLRAIEGILDLLAGLPELPADGRYGLVGGVYLADADCAEGGSEPPICGMSAPFGDVPDAPEQLPYWATCAPLAVPCLSTDDCPEGGRCEPTTDDPCERDEQCQGGNCGGDGACVEGSCQDPAGPCHGRFCRSNATCDDADCSNEDGTACVGGTCQDYVDGEQLAPLYPISYPYCSLLYEDALAVE